MSGEHRGEHRRDVRRAAGDTLAWLCAAFQIIAPVLLVLIVVILLAYGVIHFLFFR